MLFFEKNSNGFLLISFHKLKKFSNSKLEIFHSPIKWILIKNGDDDFIANKCKIFFSIQSQKQLIDYPDLRVTKFYKFSNKQTIDRLFASNNLSQVSKIN